LNKARVRVGVAGARFMGKAHAESHLHYEAEIAMVASGTEANARRRNRTCPPTEAGTSRRRTHGTSMGMRTWFGTKRGL
jgi:hypothetical protein